MASRSCRSCVVFCLASLAGASTGRRAEEAPADLILKVGRIWTGDPGRPCAEALASRVGEVAAVGTAASVEPFRGPKTRVVDLPDAFATPGLVDAHAHLINLGRLGMLKVGRRADVTVVDRDLFRVPPEDLLKVRVGMTVIDGEPVYESGGR